MIDRNFLLKSIYPETVQNFSGKFASSLSGKMTFINFYLANR